MTNIDETTNKIDSLLTDRGLTSEYKEQAVRQLLYHLYIALDIYRYMTCSEKNKAGYWYRMFRSSFSLTGFLKERKRKRDKEKSPLHPSYKERETMLKEKGEKKRDSVADALSTLEERKEAFRQEIQAKYRESYPLSVLCDFFYYWSEEDKETGKMLFEKQRTWNTEHRFRRWLTTSYNIDNAAAAIRLKRLKKKEPEREPEREQKQRQLEQEIAERKRNAVSYEEYLKMKSEK